MTKSIITATIACCLLATITFATDLFVDTSLYTSPNNIGAVPYTGATADVDLGVYSCLFGGNLAVYGGNSKSPTTASIRGATTGGLVLNGYGSAPINLNYDSGTGGVIFNNGSGTQVAAISSTGAATFGSYLSLYSGAAASPGIPSVRGASTGAMVINAYGSGALNLNYDSGTGGVLFFNGSGTQEASVDGAGHATFKQLVVTPGFLGTAAGASVSSASTITATGQAFHVTGTTTINTINLPFTGFTGTIRIIPDGVFLTGTSGNIAIASTAVVSKTLEMTYDGSKWYPSY